MALITGKLRAIMALDPARVEIDFEGREFIWGELAGVVGRIEALRALRPSVLDGPGRALPPGALGVTFRDVVPWSVCRRTRYTPDGWARPAASVPSQMTSWRPAGFSPRQSSRTWRPRRSNTITVA